MLTKQFFRLALLVLSALTLFACSGGGDDDTAGNNNGGSTPSVETFSVQLSQESISIEPNANQTINYTLNREGSSNFDIEVTLASNPSLGQVTIDADNNRFSYTANNEGSGSFSILFKSASLQINKQIVYQVKAPEVVDPDPNKPVLGNDQEYIIHLPSDHITIYEDETITFDIRRNYQINDQIKEEFYFNSDNIQGTVSDDKTQITLSAIDSEEDTYGEITAVTNVNGILHESKMYLIYYNKNRDLTTPEPPVVALLEHEILIKPYASTVKAFDIYDPDSDRISYRVLASPNFAQTHMMKVEGGYELTIHAIDTIDPNDNDVVLEVSDGHRKDIHTFNLIEDKSVSNKKNQPPKLSIEENVTVSLIKQFTGSEKGLIAELAFVHSDPDGDPITLSAKASVNNKFSFNIQPPYLYVRADDISDLQYEQITLVASDGQFDTKMTFHFYIKDNFLKFLSGNPNTAPMSDLPTKLNLLEGKRIEIPFRSYDHEKHPFDIGIAKDSAVVTSLLTDTNLVLTASTPEVTTQSSITIWLEDVFESRREHTIALNIFKNTTPKLNLDFVATDEDDDAPYLITEPEQTPVEIKVTVTDPDQPDLEPTFVFDSNFITVSYDKVKKVATVNSVDLGSDYKGQLKVVATDEFNAVAEQIVELNYQFKDPNNQFPKITIAQQKFTLLPGEKGSTKITIVDPENDPLVINSLKDSDDITYTYNIATGDIEFEVSDKAAFEQELTITISASDGFGLSQENIVVKVPKSPEAPKLTVDFFEPKVKEKQTFIVTFSATDANENTMTATTVQSTNPGFTVKIVPTTSTPGILKGHLEVTPTTNVLTETNYSFTLFATDTTGKFDSKSITFTVQPVNDPPTVEFVVLDGVKPGESGEIILANNTPVNLNYGIKDPDTTGQTVRILYDVKKGQYEVEKDVFKDYEFYIESFVTAADNKVRVNGNSKEDIFGYVSSNKGSLAVNGDTYQDTMKLQVQEDIGDGSGNQHGDDKDVNITLKFVNNKPVVGSFDLIQMFESRDQMLNLVVSDGDVPDRTKVKAGEEQVCITINNSSAFLELWDLRPTPAVKLDLGRKHCDTDLNGPLTQVRINTLPVTKNESEFFTINVTDGFENTSQIVNIEVINN